MPPTLWPLTALSQCIWPGLFFFPRRCISRLKPRYVSRASQSSTGWLNPCEGAEVSKSVLRNQDICLDAPWDLCRYRVGGLFPGLGARTWLPRGRVTNQQQAEIDGLAWAVKPVRTPVAILGSLGVCISVPASRHWLISYSPIHLN